MVLIRDIQKNGLLNLRCNTCHNEKPLKDFSCVSKYYNNRCKQCCSDMQMKKYIYAKKFPIKCKVCETIKYTYYKKTIYCSTKCHNIDIKDVIKKARDIWYEKNKDNPEFILRRRNLQRTKRIKNKDKINQRQRDNYPKNKQRQIEYVLTRLKRDNLYRFKFYFRNSLRDFFTKRKIKKENPSSKILGCNWLSFIRYIESQFKEGMTWSNYGGKRYNEDGTIRRCWEIDHIIPMYTANTREDVIRLNHHTNLRPLWWWENIEEEVRLKCHPYWRMSKESQEIVEQNVVMEKK